MDTPLVGWGGVGTDRIIGEVLRTAFLPFITGSSSRGSRKRVMVESLKLSGSTAVVEESDPSVACRSWINSS